MFRKQEKKIIRIEGMSCAHCAKKVETALSNIDNITKAKVNLKEKLATITLKGNVADTEIKQKIEELDYQVLNIKTV